MSSDEEQDACNVCERDNSPSKNPIMFCDGKGCNMPVHKRCYGLKQVPDGDWFCQRCENKKKKKATNIICCPVQAGAIKKTKLQDKYMHIVCALWNKDIDNTVEPYPVPESRLNKQTCGFCLKKVGLCISCEEPDCSECWHVTCAINNNIITPAASVPASFSARCVKHEIKSSKSKSSSSSTPQKKKGRRLVKSKKISDSEDSDEDEDDDFEGQDDDDDEDDDDDDDEEEEEEDEDEEMGPEKKKDNKGKDSSSKKQHTDDSNKDSKVKDEDDSSSNSSSGAVSNQAPAKKVLAIGNKQPLSSSSAIASGLGTSSATRSPSLKKEIPMKRRLSPNSLFGHDQSSDDSDDDMGTKSRPKSTNSNASSNNSGNNHGKSLASMSSKHAERIEAKRKKSGLESVTTSSSAAPAPTRPSILEDIKRPPTSLTPPLPTGTPTKQKLPNKAHLLNNTSTSTNASNSSTNSNTPSSISNGGNGHRPVITPPIKKQSGPGIIKDIDEIQNDIRAGAQRWNNTSSTPLHHPQPTTPHSISTAFFENDGKSRMDNNRKSMNGGEKEELMRMREENRKLIDFKRSVTEVLTNLNVPLQSGLLPSQDVDNYVAQLQMLLKRVGPIRENERVQIQECVKGALQHTNNNPQHPQ
ncbi:hypothetical protein FB192DRAFT_1396611 [Mucor lusitanicus]|uniref:PHD-type domain-containing protein n=1 Tax=Mucor circinelloides f. lusitanicus TaxID=29924 RepID=A0A8H4EYJ3_MUCCL|nr:hypothetical protein FB192DRAFT_1396611 [Mucor lusitanicus]